MLEYALFEELVKDVAKDKTIASRSYYPLVLDFSKEWHKELINYEELGAEIVDLSAEGITKLWPFQSDKALKFRVNAGETKYLRISVSEGHQSLTYFVLMYLTGTVTASEDATWVGTTPIVNYQNDWAMLSARCWTGGITVKFNGGDSGGTVYIGLISIWHETGEFNQRVDSYPEQTLDGTTTYTYGVSFLIPNEKTSGLLRMACLIEGDGTNAINVNVDVYTPDGWKTVASFSRVSTGLTWYNAYIPVKCYTLQTDIPFFIARFVVSGYGRIRRYFSIFKQYDVEYYINGLKTASASNVSTTVTKYTLVDNNGRGNRYKQASVSLSSPSGGTAKLYINGQLVADYSGSSGTFNIPDDVDIWKIEVDLAGNGTTSATANFNGIELLGPYIVRR